MKDLLWIHNRVGTLKGAQTVWVYLLISQAKQELRGNSAVAYKYILDYTLVEKKGFSWIFMLEIRRLLNPHCNNALEQPFTGGMRQSHS